MKALIIGKFLGLSALVFFCFIAPHLIGVLADRGDGKLSGNWNYTVYKSNGGTIIPDEKIYWGGGVTTSGGCAGCWSYQTQLYYPNKNGGIQYQEVMSEITNGNGGCVSSYCNSFCIADWLSHSGCIMQSFSILTGYDLGSPGWSLEFYVHLVGSTITAFYLSVYNSFTHFSDIFVIYDPNKSPVYGAQINIVGVDSAYPFANFCCGTSGTAYYIQVSGYPYSQISNQGDTTENSNMCYAQMNTYGSGYDQLFLSKTNGC